MSEPTSNVPEQPKSKSGLSPMAWIAIGCGVVILLAFVAFMALGAFVFKKGKEVAQEVSGSDSLGEFMENLEEDPARTAAEMAIRLNPDLEILETDAEKGVISFWNPTTEETWTVDFEDAAAGRFKVTGSEGEYTLDGEGGGVTVTTPEGVTRIGASADVGDVPSWVELYPGFTSAEGSYHSVQGDTVAGTVSLLVPDEPEEVKEHYRNWFEDEGWEVTSESTTTSGGVTYANIVGEHSDDGRTITAAVVRQSGETRVTITYNGRR